MTPDEVPSNFERTMGCTVDDLLRCLPIAVPGGRLKVDASAGHARAEFADGSLRLSWRTVAERRIALLVIPCLQVRFEFDGLSAGRRHEVQRRFDLATQRGGG